MNKLTLIAVLLFWTLVSIKGAKAQNEKVKITNSNVFTSVQFKSVSNIDSSKILFNQIFEGFASKIVSFAMYFTGPGFEEKNEVVEVVGKDFNKEAKKYMARLKKGSTVVIGVIKIIEKDEKIIDLDGNMTFVLE